MRVFSMLPRIAGVALLAVCFAYPVVNFLLLPLFPALSPLPPTLGDAGGGVSWVAVGNSVRLGIEAGIGVLPIGLWLGFLLERRRWPGAKLVSGCIWLLFLMPSYLLTDGWQILFATPALRDSVLHRMFYSEAGIVAMFVLKGLPFAVFASRAGWAAVGGEISAALRVHVRARSARWAITARLLLPSVGSIFAVVFIEAIEDFGISATIGARLHMPLAVYQVYRHLAATPVDFVAAASSSWVLVALAAIAVMVHLRLSRHVAKTVHGRRQAVAIPACSAAGSALGWLAAGALALVGGVIPVVSLLTQALGVQDREVAAARLDADDIHALGFSLVYAALAGTIAVAITCGVLSAGNAGRGRRNVVGQLLQWLPFANMAVPGIVLGAAYVIAFNTNLLPLYGTPLLLVMAYVATHLPMLIRFLQAPMGQLHAGLGDAARLHGMDRLARIEQIHTPLLLRPLVWAWAMSFGSVFFELPVSELLYPAGGAPVAVRLLGLDETLHYAAEAKLALLATALCIASVGIVAVLVPRFAGTSFSRMQKIATP